MIDTILTYYFSVFPTLYLLVIIAFGIMSILLYALYGYLED